MTFNQKIIFFSLIVIALVAGSGVFFLKKSRPVPVPIVAKPEKTLTFIPGWNLRQVAEYIVKEGFASSTEGVYQITGYPAYDYRPVAMQLPVIGDSIIVREKPAHASYEGYLAPETYRFFTDASVVDIVEKLLDQRDKEITDSMRLAVEQSGHSWNEVIIMASILEKEVRDVRDKAVVSDILWRRLAKNWALQVDSSVHYITDRTGDVFTKEKERQIDSPWNTYKYPGLPLGPISNPGVDSIIAAIFPEKNSYWYFLTGHDGTVYYGKTLDEHNFNKRYL